MKRTLAILAVGLIGASAMAQSLNIVCGNVTYIVPASQAGDMTYSGDSLLTVMGRALPVGEISHMYVDGSVPSDNTVTVAYDGKSAAITVAGNIMRFVSFAGDGAAVTATQSSALSATDGGEITYRLSGTSAEGSFALDGSYKSTIALDGLTLTSPAGPAIDIRNGKRIKLIVGDGSSNSLCDAAGGTHKGALYCKGHLEISGTGTLDVKGLTAHAIAAKEYITLEGATVRVTAAVKDGINCNQSFTLNSGSIDISGTGDDGLQTSFKDETDRQSDDTGTITINSGTVKCTVTATATKGLKADGDVIVKGGEISVTTSGGGKWDSTEVKTKASTCISADGNVNIDGGKLTLSSSGSGGKAISCDLDLNISDGTIVATTTGGLFAYVNGTEYSDYTGNTDRIDSDYKSSPKAIKADGNVNISGGNITVSTKGNGAEGIESKAVMTITGGTISAYTRDDALNSSSHMYIKHHLRGHGQRCHRLQRQPIHFRRHNTRLRGLGARVRNRRQRGGRLHRDSHRRHHPCRGRRQQLHAHHIRKHPAVRQQQRLDDRRLDSHAQRRLDSPGNIHRSGELQLVVIIAGRTSRRRSRRWPRRRSRRNGRPGRRACLLPRTQIRKLLHPHGRQLLVVSHSTAHRFVVPSLKPLYFPNDFCL